MPSAANVSALNRRPQRTIPSWSRRPASMAAIAISSRLANGYRLPSARRWSGTVFSAAHRLIVLDVAAVSTEPIHQLPGRSESLSG